MKKFIIMSMSMDDTTCNDDGIFSACNFDVVGTRACDSLEEAIAVRDETIETDLADFQELWTEEDGYSFDVGNLGNDKYLDVYYNGDVVNETIYRIRGVEF